MLKIGTCKVKPYKLIPRDEDKIDNIDKKDENKEEIEEKQDKTVDEEHVESDDEEANKVYIARDVICSKYMQMENCICSLESAVSTVEVPVSTHKKLEIKEAKMKEIKNLEDFDNFE